MKKKFRLIKWYPPLKIKEGWIVEWDENQNPSQYIHKFTGLGVSGVDVSKYPEFWEEIVEKNPLKLEVGKTYKLQYKHCKSPIRTCKITRITTDGYPWMECPDYHGIVSPDCYNLIEEIIEKDYEILSWKYNNKIFSLLNEKSKNGYVYCKEGSWLGLNSLKNNYTDNYNIHSIKRLSDENNIFTVNDRVKYNNENYTISRFEVLNEKCLVGLIGMQCLVNLNEIEHSKPVLFTTFDGVDIFEGDKVWGINECTWIPFYQYATELKLREKWKYGKFSTKEVAEEYINSRKPYLSNKDVLGEIEKCTNIQQLKEIFTNKAAY